MCVFSIDLFKCSAGVYIYTHRVQRSLPATSMRSGAFDSTKALSVSSLPQLPLSYNHLCRGGLA